MRACLGVVAQDSDAGECKARIPEVLEWRITVPPAVCLPGCGLVYASNKFDRAPGQALTRSSWSSSTSPEFLDHQSAGEVEHSNVSVKMLQT